MPIFENMCRQEGCEAAGDPFEWYAATRDKPDPICARCGSSTVRLISSFAVVFTGAITKKYNDPKLENYHQEGHTAWRRRSSKSGKPEPVRIETFEDQRRFCKEEGLVDPRETGPLEAAADGRTSSSRGLPGCW
jgi:predicted nucleic acid-binding Zn ribbon protein